MVKSPMVKSPTTSQQSGQKPHHYDPIIQLPLGVQCTQWLVLVYALRVVRNCVHHRFHMCVLWFLGGGRYPPQVNFL